jgi:hypothetical protein
MNWMLAKLELIFNHKCLTAGLAARDFCLHFAETEAAFGKRSLTGWSQSLNFGAIGLFCEICFCLKPAG